ncbi:Gfo/Idh/MocA family protein [Pseudaminobacter sp. NGMCC 1.201702]|uniref:Gfo/Idh/MocA family protein n=1 Tax=Pseudaminobacter sp. NGMCC 1.201702 TaxID=3391825 RepID=UPI0039EE05DB
MTGAATEKTFGWGIVGTGGIAHGFAADLAHAPGTRLVAVHSRAQEKALAFGKTFAAERAYADLDALLSDPAVDAVYIATPNALHAEQTLRAIDAGKPVLVEKPLGISADEAARIAAAAKDRSVFVMEAMWTRFLPAVRRAREKIIAGAIGKVTSIRAELSYHRDEVADSRFFERSGGGAALDLGVYPLSLTLHFLGRPRAVSGRWQAAGSGVDRRTEIELHYADAKAVLSCGFDHDGGNSFLIEGTNGAIRLDAPFLKAQRLTSYSPFARNFAPQRQRGGLSAKLLDRMPFPGRKTEHFPFPGGGLQFQAIAVMDAIKRGETACETMPLAESEAVLAIIGEVLSQDPS